MAGLRLRAELGGDGSGFDAMMRRANATKDRFAGAFAGLKGIIAGAFTIGAITNLSRKTIDFAGNLRDVSDALRVNVEWFQKRANAARLAGGSEKDLEKFIGTLNKSREEAFNRPGEEQSQRFARLGFSESEVSGLNTMEFFDRIVKAYANGADAQTAVDVEKVGGKSARNLLAAFSSGMEENGSIMSEDVINQLDDIGDEFTILGNELMVSLAPAILAVANAITATINKIKVALAYLQGGTPITGAVQARLATLPTLKSNGEMQPGGKFKSRQERAEWAAAQELLRQEREATALGNARARIRAERRAKESTGPGFSGLDLTFGRESKPRGAALQTDSLVGIGNFLGRNPGLVNSVANQQLTVARQHVRVAEITLQVLKDKLSNPSPAMIIGNINVP